MVLRNKRKVFASSLLVLIGLIVGMHYVISHSERQSEKRRVAYCEMLKIARALEDDLSTTGKVPSKLSESKHVVSLNGASPCAGQMQLVDGEFLDPWGKPYSYQVFSSSTAVIRGANDLEVSIPRESTSP